VAAVPAAVTAPRQGKWWNDATHSWVLTDLSKADVPDNDDDLLKKLEDDLDAAGAPSGANTGAVKETFYYDALEVDPKAEPSAIKRRYYVLARKYHPDKVAADDKESADKFKEVAEAYQVLSDPKLREKYDKDGREGLSGDKTEVNEDRNADPAVDARTLQERRCTRLAKKLAEKIDPWVKEDYDMCKALWQTEATTLSMASHGWELVKTIGMVSSFLIDSLFHSNMFQKSCRLFSAD
jgi:hypothetical protein